ncbi:MAG: outer membrane beta-barrel protein [Bacteroidota bacterium]
MMEDKFDHIIKGKLEEVEVPFNELHWEDMEAHLDQMEGGPAVPEEHDFDTVLFNRLNHLSANDQLKDLTWNAIVQELGQFAALREQILQFKLVEAILVSLLLLLVVRFGIDDQPAPFGKDFNGQPQAYHQHQTPTDSPDLQIDSEINIPAEQEGSEFNLGQGVINSTPPPNVVLNTNATEVTNKKEPREQITAMIPVDELPQQNILADHIDQNSVPSVRLLPAESFASNESDFALLAAADISALTSTDMLVGLPSNLSSLTNPRKAKYQISMFGGGEYNYISTPESADGRFQASNRFTLGYRGGLLIDRGIANSRWRFGSGLIYTAKQYGGEYQRLTGSALRGFTGESLEQIEHNILNIPIFARYNFLQRNRWSMFTQAGLSMQVAFQSNYYVGLPDLPQPTLRGANVDITPRSTSGIKERAGGILEGESFRESSFFSGNFALGYERSMTDRLRLFMQSKYEYSIGYFSQGLGPTQDRINTISLETGIRVKLK